MQLKMEEDVSHSGNFLGYDAEFFAKDSGNLLIDFTTIFQTPDYQVRIIWDFRDLSLLLNLYLYCNKFRIAMLKLRCWNRKGMGVHGVLVSHFVEGEGFPTLTGKIGPIVPKVPA